MARERALSPGLEESGLGLLARFAASALPSPTVGPSLSVVQLEAKQKARKKEERQNMMGEYQQVECGASIAPFCRQEMDAENGRSLAGGQWGPALWANHVPSRTVGTGNVDLSCPRRGLRSYAG